MRAQKRDTVRQRRGAAAEPGGEREYEPNMPDSWVEFIRNRATKPTDACGKGSGVAGVDEVVGGAL